MCSVPASGSSVSHTNADARTDANLDAQPHSYASKHERPHTDVSAREQARTATPVPPPANWITIEQAIQRFSDAGFHRKLRTVQKYCTNARLSSHLALTGVGFNYFVDPASIEAFIAREAQMAPLTSDSDLDDGTAPARTAAQPHAQPRPDAHDDARTASRVARRLDARRRKPEGGDGDAARSPRREQCCLRPSHDAGCSGMSW